jgi:hypothetical protein
MTRESTVRAVVVLVMVGASAGGGACRRPGGDRGDVPGYLHPATKSRFHLGGGIKNVKEGSLTKIVGDEGVIATNTVTGAVRAILNSDSPADERPAYSTKAEAHNARVLKYFTEAGLPRDQIGMTQVLTLMAADGSSEKPSEGVRGKFVAYTTVITRQIDGVPVPDSFAAARFNQDDEATMEWVYWPKIPRKALEDAKALQVVVADRDKHDGLLARLPGTLRSAPHQVTIRHSDFADESGYRAFASLDVQVSAAQNGGLRGGTRSFDPEGKELQHPNRRLAESARLPNSPKQ